MRMKEMAGRKRRLEEVSLDQEARRGQTALEERLGIGWTKDLCYISQVYFLFPTLLSFLAWRAYLGCLCGYTFSSLSSLSSFS